MGLSGPILARSMKRLLLFALLLGLSGCVIYLDNPPLRSISGRVFRADTGAPISGAGVTFYSGRKPFSLLPVDTFGINRRRRLVCRVRETQRKGGGDRAER